MFSATERFGSRWLSWWTALMPRRCACCGECSETSAPPFAPSNSLMLPASGAHRPVRTLISVDLPAPFCPISACTSPARSARSTPASACPPGKARETPRASSTMGRSLIAPRSVLARLDVLLRGFHREHLLVDQDALGDRLASDHLRDRGHELRSEQ